MMHLNTDDILLYDLTKDLGEKNDLSQSMPDLARKLKDKLKAYLKNVGAEDIRDMRAARRAELLEYKARAQRNIDKVRKAMENASTKKEKDTLGEKLAFERKRAKAHDEGLKQLRRSCGAKSW
jgi:Na+/phosphate symporter